MDSKHKTTYTIEVEDTEAMNIVNEITDIYNILIQNNVSPSTISTVLKLKDCLVSEMS